MFYARKVKKNPKKSLVYELEQQEKNQTEPQEEIGRFTKRQMFCLILLVSAICFNVFGILHLVGHLMK